MGKVSIRKEEDKDSWGKNKSLSKGPSRQDVCQAN